VTLYSTEKLDNTDFLWPMDLYFTWQRMLVHVKFWSSDTMLGDNAGFYW